MEPQTGDPSHETHTHTKPHGLSNQTHTFTEPQTHSTSNQTYTHTNPQTDSPSYDHTEPQAHSTSNQTYTHTNPQTNSSFYHHIEPQAHSTSNQTDTHTEEQQTGSYSPSYQTHSSQSHTHTKPQTGSPYYQPQNSQTQALMEPQTGDPSHETHTHTKPHGLSNQTHTCTKSHSLSNQTHTFTEPQTHSTSNQTYTHTNPRANSPSYHHIEPQTHSSQSHTHTKPKTGSPYYQPHNRQTQTLMEPQTGNPSHETRTHTKPHGLSNQTHSFTEPQTHSTSNQTYTHTNPQTDSASYHHTEPQTYNPSYQFCTQTEEHQTGSPSYQTHTHTEPCTSSPSYQSCSRMEPQTVSPPYQTHSHMEPQCSSPLYQTHTHANSQSNNPPYQTCAHMKPRSRSPPYQTHTHTNPQTDSHFYHHTEPWIHSPFNQTRTYVEPQTNTTSRADTQMHLSAMSPLMIPVTLATTNQWLPSPEVYDSSAHANTNIQPSSPIKTPPVQNNATNNSSLLVGTGLYTSPQSTCTMTNSKIHQRGHPSQRPAVQQPHNIHPMTVNPSVQIPALNSINNIPVPQAHNPSNMADLQHQILRTEVNPSLQQSIAPNHVSVVPTTATFNNIPTDNFSQQFKPQTAHNLQPQQHPTPIVSSVQIPMHYIPTTDNKLYSSLPAPVTTMYLPPYSTPVTAASVSVSGISEHHKLLPPSSLPHNSMGYLCSLYNTPSINDTHQEQPMYTSSAQSHDRFRQSVHTSSDQRLDEPMKSCYPSPPRTVVSNQTTVYPSDAPSIMAIHQKPSNTQALLVQESSHQRNHRNDDNTMRSSPVNTPQSSHQLAKNQRAIHSTSKPTGYGRQKGPSSDKGSPSSMERSPRHCIVPYEKEPVISQSLHYDIDSDSSGSTDHKLQSERTQTKSRHTKAERGQAGHNYRALKNKSTISKPKERPSTSSLEKTKAPTRVLPHRPSSPQPESLKTSQQNWPDQKQRGRLMK